MEAGAADGENRPTWPAQLEFKLGSRKKAHFVAGPVRIKVGSNDDDEGELEYTVHTCPARLVPEMKRIFPESAEQIVASCGKVYVVITFQPSRTDLIDWSDEAAQDKDLLLENFVAWGRNVCEQLRRDGHWADLSDPCSGHPVIGDRGGLTYCDTSGIELLLPYDRIQVGSCEVVSHPQWRTAVYPATLFTSAPYELLQAALLAHSHLITTAAAPICAEDA
ncbi:protein c2orf25, mitochondrial, putative [Acanthamoeba castellanii str. Neff]|uniref:Protein c2orf25, mitochondrial, putative n=1 Tax=Acanthamoeba castellanii (strain ATCC 30010 / Neff) TaxID=1257118 RepID=L8GW99_ACACF|nr:protein c2orf25, mitochondrial, putative [Acanthamoeba castellanii str. Neff]ELR16371.1 protein c2orf25, mitochondrial, putative [Acanthamoeba castellanii str. Neff]